MTVDELPEPARAKLAAILARSPADWRPGEITPGQDPGTWVIELVNGDGEPVASVIVAGGPDKGALP